MDRLPPAGPSGGTSQLLIPGPVPTPPVPVPKPAAAPPKPRAKPAAKRRARSADASRSRYSLGPRTRNDPNEDRPSRPRDIYPKGKKEPSPVDFVAQSKVRQYLSMVIGYYAGKYYWLEWKPGDPNLFPGDRDFYTTTQWEKFVKNVLEDTRKLIDRSYRTHLDGNPKAPSIDAYHMRLMADDLDWSIVRDHNKKPLFRYSHLENIKEFRDAVEYYVRFIQQDPGRNVQKLRDVRDNLPFTDPEDVHHTSLTPPWMTQEALTPGTSAYANHFPELPPLYLRRKWGQPTVKQADFVLRPTPEVFDLNRALTASARHARAQARAGAADPTDPAPTMGDDDILDVNDDDDIDIDEFSPPGAPVPVTPDPSVVAPVSAAIGWAENMGILPRSPPVVQGETPLPSTEDAFPLAADSEPVLAITDRAPRPTGETNVLTPGLEPIPLPARPVETRNPALARRKSLSKAERKQIVAAVKERVQQQAVAQAPLVEEDPDATQIEPDNAPEVTADPAPNPDPVEAEFLQVSETLSRLGTSEPPAAHTFPQRNTLDYTHKLALMGLRYYILRYGSGMRERFGHLEEYQRTVRAYENLLDPSQNPSQRWVYGWKELKEAGVTHMGDVDDQQIVVAKQNEAILYDLDVISVAIQSGLWNFNGDRQWNQAFQELHARIRTPVQYDILHILDTWRRRWLAASERERRIDFRLVDATNPTVPPTLEEDASTPPPHLRPWTDPMNQRSPAYWLFTVRWQFSQDWAESSQLQPGVWKTYVHPTYQQTWAEWFREVPPLREGDAFDDAGPFPMYRLRNTEDPYENFLRFQEGVWVPQPRSLLGAATTPPENSDQPANTTPGTETEAGTTENESESRALVLAEPATPDWSTGDREIMEMMVRNAQEHVRRAALGSSQGSSQPLFTQGTTASSTQLTQPSVGGSTPDFDPSGKRASVKSLSRNSSTKEAFLERTTTSRAPEQWRERLGGVTLAEQAQKAKGMMVDPSSGPRVEMASLPKPLAPTTPPQVVSSQYGPPGQPSLTSQLPLSQPLPGPSLSPAPSTLTPSTTMGPTPPPHMSVNPRTGVTGFTPSSLPPPPASLKSLPTPDAIPQASLRSLPSLPTPDAIPRPIPTSQASSQGSLPLFSSQGSVVSSAPSSAPLFSADASSAATVPVTGPASVVSFFTPASAFVGRMDSQGPTPVLRTEDHPDHNNRAPGAQAPASDVLHPAAARHNTFASIREHYVRAGTWRPANRIRDEILHRRMGP